MSEGENIDAYREIALGKCEQEKDLSSKQPREKTPYELYREPLQAAANGKAPSWLSNDGGGRWVKMTKNQLSSITLGKVVFAVGSFVVLVAVIILISVGASRASGSSYSYWSRSQAATPKKSHSLFYLMSVPKFKTSPGAKALLGGILSHRHYLSLIGVTDVILRQSDVTLESGSDVQALRHVIRELDASGFRVHFMLDSHFSTTCKDNFYIENNNLLFTKPNLTIVEHEGRCLLQFDNLVLRYYSNHFLSQLQGLPIERYYLYDLPRQYSTDSNWKTEVHLPALEATHRTFSEGMKAPLCYVDDDNFVSDLEFECKIALVRESSWRSAEEFVATLRKFLKSPTENPIFVLETDANCTMTTPFMYHFLALYAFIPSPLFWPSGLEASCDFEVVSDGSQDDYVKELVAVHQLKAHVFETVQNFTIIDFSEMTKGLVTVLAQVTFKQGPTRFWVLLFNLKRNSRMLDLLDYYPQLGSGNLQVLYCGCREDKMTGVVQLPLELDAFQSLILTT